MNPGAACHGPDGARGVDQSRRMAFSQAALASLPFM
jgi:hypothetical protein